MTQKKTVPLKAEEEKKEAVPSASDLWNIEKQGFNQRINDLRQRQAQLLGRKELIERELGQVEDEIRMHTFTMTGGDWVSRVYEQENKKEK